MPKNAVLEKEESSKNVKEITEKEFLLLTQKGPTGSVLDVRGLWDNYYRLNFWKSFQGEKDVIARPMVVESRFVRIDKDGKFYKVHDLTKGN